MDAKRRNHRDFLQNIIISLLSLSAVILIAQTQIYSLGDSSDYFQQFLGGNSEETNPAVQSVSLSSPLRVAVSGTYGRYGDVDLVTSDESFRQLGSLLGEALGSAQQQISCSQESFAAALNRPSGASRSLRPAHADRHRRFAHHAALQSPNQLPLSRFQRR